MGAEAVMALMEAEEHTIPCVVSLDGNQVWLDSFAAEIYSKFDERFIQFYLYDFAGYSRAIDGMC